MGKYDFAFDLYEDSPLAWIARTVEPGSNVLEFGSANGRLTKYLNLEKKCSVDIVEIDETSGTEASAYAAHSFLGAEEGDIEKYYWSSSEIKYDYIIFADVLEHLFNPQEALNRCRAVISPHGRILVSIPNISHNSIIIELMNDRFQYTPTGLLDNTHVRFFTRQSFIEMAERVGWSVVSESAKYIRVGEHEIVNSYNDVSKEVYKALISRDSGNVYQYMFILASSQEYIAGECVRLISLDASSYYFTEILFEHEGNFDYKHSVNRHFNPAQKEISLSFPVLQHSQEAKIRLLNCNAILKLNIKVCSAQGTRIETDIQHNGILSDNVYYFINDNPEINLSLSENDERLVIELVILQYDFDKTPYQNLMEVNVTLQQQINQLQSGAQTYEQMIQRKDREFLDSVKIYENEIRKKDAEFLDSVNTYESVLRQKEQILQETTENYQKVISQKEQALQKTIENQQAEISQREQAMLEAAENYQKVIRQKEKELSECTEKYEEKLRIKDTEFMGKRKVYEDIISEKELALQESQKSFGRKIREWINIRRTK